MNSQFESKEYRDEFVEANTQNGVAYQIRALRKKEGWSQAELGKRCGKAQNVISRVEDPDYGKLTIRTLLDIASAFDVALSVQFVSFSELGTRLKDLSPSALAVPSFEQEKAQSGQLELSETVKALSMPVFKNTPASSELQFPFNALQIHPESAIARIGHHQKPKDQSNSLVANFYTPQAHAETQYESRVN